MASEQPVTEPLRISKSTPSQSSLRGVGRPLSEISATEKRRNSPVWTSSSKNMALSTDSSPFQSSPLEATASTRLFWQTKLGDNDIYGGRTASPSPTKRSSIERLEKASRVKNSTMFAREQKHEYESSKPPTLERPLAKVQGNAFNGTGHFGLRSNLTRSDSRATMSADISSKFITSPSSSPNRPPTPSKDQPSPMKSSLSSSRFKNSYNSQNDDVFSDNSIEDAVNGEGKFLHRHAKSVTFDAAPPQINEYEMATPDLSSVGTNSREGSYDSEEEDDVYAGYSGEGGDVQDDSFDATLEDTDKTPVVGPDDWRRDLDSRLDSSSGAEGDAGSPVAARPPRNRTDSSASSVDHRPLPPLPGMGPSGSNSASPMRLSPSSERMLNSPRNLPSPPGATKSDVQNIGNSAMSLEERLQLMMLSDESSPKFSDLPTKSFAEQQRERRMRRAGARERASSTASESEPQHSEADDDDEADHNVEAVRAKDADQSDEEDESVDGTDDEADDTLGDISALDNYELPSISRQSILQRVNGNREFDRQSDYSFNLGPPEFSSAQEAARGSPYDPDVPIASIEDSILEDFSELDDESIDERDHDEHEQDEHEHDEQLENEHQQDEHLQDERLQDEHLQDEHLEDKHLQDQHLEDEHSEDEHLEDDRLQDDHEESEHELDKHEHDEHEQNEHEQDEDEKEGQKQDEHEDDSESDMYSDSGKEDDGDLSHHSEKSPLPLLTLTEDDSSTPRPASPAQSGEITNFSATLPRVSSSSRPSDFSRSFQSYMLPKPKDAESVTFAEIQKEGRSPGLEARSQTPQLQTPKFLVSKPEYDGSGWGDPDEDEEDEEPGTPESVIHHPISDDEDESEYYDEDDAMESPAVPERIATIKASSSKLKTRPSATPSDIEAMREARRHVSREVIPDVPSIPDHKLKHGSSADFAPRYPSIKNRSLTLDIEPGLSLDYDFDRVIEAQKVGFQQTILNTEFAAASTSHIGQASGSNSETPTNTVWCPTTNSITSQTACNANVTTRKQRGYLMRQNTKLVSASDKDNEDLRPGTRSAGSSPVKQQQQRPQSWTVEPWNGKQKRSLRKRHANNIPGPVPPLPGQESNAATMSAVHEDEVPELATEECGERGRLFVKVMGVKDLDMPLPRNERTWFSLTLDNGVHCVTTTWLELARNAPIGQEFELVVPNDLEFQLTLNVKLEKPKTPKLIPASPTKMSKPKTSAFSRVFASPKKRKEMEARLRAEEEAYAQAQREAASKLSVAPTGWDLLSPLAAEDGSFARSYVCLKEHESKCYGRPYMVEIAAFNEWATEDAGFASSVKSKRVGIPSNSVVRRAPYKVGKLEVQLLFVPRPKGSTDEDMPKSMNSCIREIKAAEERLSRNWEGHLSQQGGDCPYWRRRYFKLVGTKLTAYHETTRQPRATINLSNAKRLIDDRRQLTDPETMGRNGKRRRSAFAEEEEGYMFVEEGFRIRFNNGEVIDFYADTPEDKDGWMKVLGDVIGRGGEEDDGASVNARRKWCELVLKREDTLRKRAEGRRIHSRTKSMIV